MEHDIVRKHVRAEMARLRELGWTAKNALRAAKINIAFDDAVFKGKVRLAARPEHEAYDDSFIDTWRHMRECDRERYRKELWERIERDGVWFLQVEAIAACGHWEVVDSIGGFVGDDFEDSGYDTDLKSAALNFIATQGATS